VEQDRQVPVVQQVRLEQTVMTEQQVERVRPEPPVPPDQMDQQGHKARPERQEPQVLQVRKEWLDRLAQPERLVLLGQPAPRVWYGATHGLQQQYMRSMMPSSILGPPICAIKRIHPQAQSFQQTPPTGTNSLLRAMPDPQAREALRGQPDQQGGPGRRVLRAHKAQQESPVQPEPQVAQDLPVEQDLPVRQDQVEQMGTTEPPEGQVLLVQQDPVVQQEAQVLRDPMETSAVLLSSLSFTQA